MKCSKCNNYTRVVDGSTLGGMPGIKYNYCDACGWSRAITKRPRRVRLKEKREAK